MPKKGVVLALAVAGCAAAATGPALRWSATARGPRTDGDGGAAFDRNIAGRFEALRVEAGDLTYAGLEKRLGLGRAPEAGPSFDPTGVDYWKVIRDKMELTEEEQSIYRRWGVAGVDHGQRYSMASAYLAIYRRDLPVLITTDSILHALHRSFDAILAQLEEEHFLPALTETLGRAHQVLGDAVAGLPAPLRKNAEDVDLYITVARNLLAKAAGREPVFRRCPDGEACTEDRGGAPPPAELRIPSRVGQDDLAAKVLAAIAGETASDQPALYGRKRVVVDWSQFTPRGHYTRSPQLTSYFQTLMWLGRADLGFVLGRTDAAFGAHDMSRERLDGALLGWVLRQSGYLGTLAAMDKTIGFFVGTTEDVTVAEVVAAAEQAGVRGLADLADATKVDALFQALAKGGASAQQTRSETGFRPPGGGPETPLSQVMQVFGQRLVIDSFILSKLVFDAIQFEGHAQERTMPSGLDVAAALGNDEAVALLQPELERWKYGANLFAARKLVEERPAESWQASLYGLWLSALSKLDDTPAGELPQVMRGRAWQRKQLQTQLASWAELRHDTILYAKQSYTAGIICEYPAGYVEPYPEVYGRLALFAEEARRRLGELKIADPRVDPFLTAFGTIMRKLEALARKELAAQPFDKDERAFVKDAIHARTLEDSGGCGGPPEVIYSGWYPKLLYDGAPEKWQPTIADVHTDPNSQTALEEGVGDVNFVIVAVDNKDDRAAYVGPIYSYYEFPSPERLTDEAWRARIIEGNTPARPAWTKMFQGAPVRRGPAPGAR